MSFESELASAPRIVGFGEDEVIIAALFGSVTGGGIEGREGILFATQYRVGLSVEAGFFTEDASTWGGHSMINGVSRRGRTLNVRLPDWRIKIECYEVFSGREVQEVADLIEHQRRLVLPASLDEKKWDRAWERLEEGDTKTGARVAKGILEAVPGNHPGLWLRAHLEQAEDQNEAALSTIESVLADSPDNTAMLHATRAKLLALLGRLQEAVDAATTSIEVAESADGYRWRGLSRWDLNEPRKALRDLKAAVRLEPDNGLLWYDVGRLAHDLKDRKSVREARSNLARLDLADSARSMEAAALFLDEKDEEAVALACELLSSDPSDQFVALMLIASEADDCAPIVELIPRLEEHHGGHPVFEIGVAYIYLRAGRYRVARERWEKLLEAFPRLAEESFFQPITGLVTVADLHASGELEACLEAARPWTEDQAWRKDETLEDVAGQLAWFAGQAALALGLGPEAVALLGQAQGLRKSAKLWEPEVLEEALSRAHALADQPDASTPGEDATLDGLQDGQMGTYALLRLLASRLEESGRLPQLERRSRELCDTFDHPPLVAVMGEYSVGKSTFINALLGQPLLPAGEGVTTGTITWLRYGEAQRMRVVFRDGRIEEFSSLKPVDDLVRETAEGEAARTIRHVEVFLHAPILGHISIVDTPGLNAPFPEHRETTEQFLEEADAVLFLFNVETAGRSTEAEFLGKVRQHSRKAVAVVNQIDLVPKDEAEEVIEAVHEDFEGHFAAVHGVSALRALQAVQRDDDRLLGRSRMPALKEWLDAHVLAQSRLIKEGAARDKAGEVLGDVRAEHAAFAAACDEQLGTIRRLRTEVRDWVAGPLAKSGEDAEAQLRLDLTSRVAELADAITGRSTPDQSPDLPAISGLASGLLSDCRERWGAFQQEVLSAYDEEMTRITADLRAVEGEHWSGVLDGALMELRVELQSWRKDLEDYLEQVERYSEGFVDGHGIGVAVLVEVEDGRRNATSVVRPVLTRRLEFLWSRVDQAFARWSAELNEQFAQSFGRLERKMQTESVRIRNEGFRRLEALEVRL